MHVSESAPRDVPLPGLAEVIARDAPEPSGAELPGPALPDLAPPPVKRKRGRPPLSPEEKAKRAAGRAGGQGSTPEPSAQPVAGPRGPSTLPKDAGPIPPGPMEEDEEEGNPAQAAAETVELMQAVGVMLCQALPADATVSPVLGPQEMEAYVRAWTRLYERMGVGTLPVGMDVAALTIGYGVRVARHPQAQANVSGMVGWLRARVTWRWLPWNWGRV